MSESDDEPRRIRIEFSIKANIEVSDQSQVEDQKKLTNGPQRKSSLSDAEKRAVEAFFDRAEISPLDPTNQLKELEEDAPKVKAFLLKSGEYFLD